MFSDRSQIDLDVPLGGHTAKTYMRGTHRLIPPAETLARLKPLLPQMGITRLANVTGLDTIGIPVVMSVRPCSRSLSVSQGKGLDLDSAKASAAMESIEGYHAERVSGSWSTPLTPRACGGTSSVLPSRVQVWRRAITCSKR
jgi:YcaO-like protein with predicted kinase domain